MAPEITPKRPPNVRVHLLFAFFWRFWCEVGLQAPIWTDFSLQNVYFWTYSGLGLSIFLGSPSCQELAQNLPRTCQEPAKNPQANGLLQQNAQNQRRAAMLPPGGLQLNSKKPHSVREVGLSGTPGAHAWALARLHCERINCLNLGAASHFKGS